MKQRIFLIIALATLSFTFIQDFIDKALREMVVREQLAPIQKPANIDPDKVELGRLLFFDKLLSGNKDISCATCHHPSFNSGDSLVLSIGVGGTGLGGSRQMGKNRHHGSGRCGGLFVAGPGLNQGMLSRSPRAGHFLIRPLPFAPETRIKA